MKNHFYRLVALSLLLCYHGNDCYATHLLGGQIKVDKLPGSALTYKITLFRYGSVGATVTPGGQLDFGDGTSIDLGANDFLKSEEFLNEEVTLIIHEVQHTFSGAGIYVVSVQESSRNGGVLNISSSSEMPFYVESLIIVDPFIGANTQPQFTFQPIDKAISGKTFFYNPGAYDQEGDSLAYQLVVPKQNSTTAVSEYSFPNDIKHYAGLDYNVANEAMNGPPILMIDATTGNLTWDAPGLVGEYSMAIKVEEWRKIQGKWINIGFRILDMQITVEESNNGRSGFSIPNDTCVVANSLVTASLSTTDPDGHEVFFTTASEVYHLSGNPATFTTDSEPSGGTNFLDFSWQPFCENVRNRPYAVYFKSKDSPPPSEGSGLAVYKTWNITVAGAPEGLHGQVKDIGEITLNWSDYFCSAAKSMAIYRIENSFSFAQDNCQPGVPEGSGFELIAEVDSDDNSFVDDNDGSGLEPNTNYCYRLVAIFDDNIGGESVASAEFCAKPNEESLVTGLRDRATGSDLEDYITIYPNPARKMINIDFNLPGFQSLVIGISDLQGKVFRQQQLLLHNNHHQMSLEGTAPGMYLIWVKTATHLIARKIVIN